VNLPRPGRNASAMTVPSVVRDALTEATGFDVKRATSVGGGRSSTARLETKGGDFFAKWATGPNAETFVPESKGLRALRQRASGLVIPESVAASPAANGAPGFLVTPWIETSSAPANHAKALGEGLAALHQADGEEALRKGQERYGFADDNFIGAMPQVNTWERSWPAFFRACRLEPQARWAHERGHWQKRWDGPFERVIKALPELLPDTPFPSLVHGDLWGGNVLPLPDGGAALIDPAVYIGHREVDLAMTELFGRFDDAFYDAYGAAWPLDEGYTARRPIYNLYHLINHLNIFGAGYARSVEQALTRIARRH